MSLDLRDIEKFLLVKGMGEAKTVKILKEISQNFTSKRENIGHYVTNEEWVSAYTQFYLPTNIPKYSFVMDMLPQSVRNDIQNSIFIDMGTGPGTFSIAHLDYFEGEVNRLISVDTSSVMLKQAKSLIDGLYPKAKVDYRESINTVQREDSNVTLFWGHSLNEMGFKKALDLIESISPDYIFFIEPGTPTVFEEVMKIRSALASKSHVSVYPCPSIDLVCPYAKNFSKESPDWCHQVLRMVHEPGVERLSQLINLDRKAMPLIAHVYSKQSLTDFSFEGKARMTRFLSETKHSFEWEVCFKDSDELKKCTFEIPKRTLKKKDIKMYQNLSVGIEFEYKVLKELRDDLIRVEVIGLGDH